MYPVSEKQRAMRVLYLNLMSEAKLRLEVIESALNGKYKVPHVPLFEFCYLQLRYVCEIVALSALAVHGEHPEAQASKIKRKYEADWILNRLERLHPTFYPVPGVPIPDSKLGMEFTPLQNGFITKKELLALYAKCGEVLHRGRFNTLKMPTNPDFEPIGKYATKIYTLFNFHSISLIGTDAELWVWFTDPADGKIKGRLVGPRHIVVK